MPSRGDPSLRSPARWQAIIGGAIVPLVILAGWCVTSAAGVLPGLPSPASVVVAAADLARRGELLDDATVSIQRVLTGFAFGSATGLVLGVFVGRARTAGMLLSPLIVAVRSVPTMAWFPLLLIYLGIGEAPKVVLIAIGALFPVFANVVGAFGQGDPPTDAPLRGVLPSIVSGLRLALAQSWVLVVAAELLHSSSGLGFLLTESSASGRVDRLVVAIVLLATLGRVSDMLIGLVERRLLPRPS